MTLSARTGAITDSGDVLRDVTGGNVVLNAAAGVGTGTSAIDTAADAVSGNTASGGFFASDLNDVMVNTITVASNENISVSSETGSVTVNASQTLAASGSGTVTLTGQDGVTLNSGATVSTADGGIAISGNLAAGTNATTGVSILGASVQSTGQGDINITGFGGTDSATGGAVRTGEPSLKSGCG